MESGEWRVESEKRTRQGVKRTRLYGKDLFPLMCEKEQAVRGSGEWRVESEKRTRLFKKGAGYSKRKQAIQKGSRLLKKGPGYS